MTAKYFAILTNYGATQLANAVALGTQMNISAMAVGDGGGTLLVPDPAQTKLVRENRRAAVNQVSIDEKNPNFIIAEQVIPENEGGWWIREIGLFDDTGGLIAVGNAPETYKPNLQEGSGRTQVIQMVLMVSSTQAITLKVDPSVVLATREYVTKSIDAAIQASEARAAQTYQPKGDYVTNPYLKLEMLKKFDKADISQQLGNDTGKVPSLHLLTTEVGKLQPKGDYALRSELNKKADADIFTSSPITKILNSTKTHFIQLSNGGYFEVKRASDDVATFQFNPQGIMTAGEIPISFVSGFNEVFIGSIGHFPFRATRLPKKWYALNGDRFSVTSAQGEALKALPAEMKSDWGITESGGMINLPNIKQSDGRVPFLRPINGTSRLPGSVESDCQQEMTGFFGGRDIRGANGWTSFFWGETGVFTRVKRASGSGQAPQTQTADAGDWSGVEFKASNQVRTGDEVRPLNIGVTVAIFLGV